MKKKIIAWAVDAGIRAVKTMAQTAIGTITGAVVFSEVDWLMVLSASGLAGVACLLMSIGTFPALTELTAKVESEE